MKKIGKRQEGGERRKELAIFHRHPLFSRKTRNRPTWPKGPTDSSAARFIFSADRPSRSFMMISRFRVPPPSLPLPSLLTLEISPDHCAESEKLVSRTTVINCGSRQSVQPAQSEGRRGKSRHENRRQNGVKQRER